MKLRLMSNLSLDTVPGLALKYTGYINLGQFYPVFTFFATYQTNRTVSCIIINRRAPIFHCVLIIFSFSMFVKAEIRQKLKNVPKTKGH